MRDGPNKRFPSVVYRGKNMNIVLWTLLGATIGAIGHAFDTSPARGGLVGAIFFGIGGALLGGGLATLLFGTHATQFDFSLTVIAFSGGLLLLLVQRTIFSKGPRF